MEIPYKFKDCLKYNWWLFAIALFKLGAGYSKSKQEMSGGEFLLMSAGVLIAIILILYVYWYLRYERKQRK